MKTLLSILFAVVLQVSVTMPCRASLPTDTLDCRFRSREIIVPAALIGFGSVASAIPAWRKDVDKRIDREIGSSRRWRAAAYVEWLPYVAALGAGYVGANASSPIEDRLLLSATSFVVLEAVTQPLKRVIGRRRPDGSDCHSFPSGHTATAFAGAELTRMIYGPVWGTGAYIVATGVAAMRMAGRHHYLSDCIAGAGIGILSARAAAWLLPFERRLLRLDRRMEGNSDPHRLKPAEIAFLPVISTEGASASLLLTF